MRLDNARAQDKQHQTIHIIGQVAVSSIFIVLLLSLHGYRSFCRVFLHFSSYIFVREGKFQPRHSGSLRAGCFPSAELLGEEANDDEDDESLLLGWRPWPVGWRPSLVEGRSPKTEEFNSYDHRARHRTTARRKASASDGEGRLAWNI